jgi:hypothetical protein
VDEILVDKMLAIIFSGEMLAEAKSADEMSADEVSVDGIPIDNLI